ncbi:MAG: hypothetical protein LKF36_15305 [Lactobacillus sp.]|jgi:hypothetical protein|nr:hypothetical protein [Lactobacillus sp.]
MIDNNGVFQATGAELLKEAVTDWKLFSENESFVDWFPDAAWIMPKKRYQFDSELSGIEEVEHG